MQCLLLLRNKRERESEREGKAKRQAQRHVRGANGLGTLGASAWPVLQANARGISGISIRSQAGSARAAAGQDRRQVRSSMHRTFFFS